MYDIKLSTSGSQQTFPIPVEDLRCPLTYEYFTEPVVDKHGHMFEKSAIFKWAQINGQMGSEGNFTCPVNRGAINIQDLNPVLLSRHHAQAAREKENKNTGEGNSNELLKRLTLLCETMSSTLKQTNTKIESIQTEVRELNERLNTQEALLTKERRKVIVQQRRIDSLDDAFCISNFGKVISVMWDVTKKDEIMNENLTEDELELAGEIEAEAVNRRREEAREDVYNAKEFPSVINGIVGPHSLRKKSALSGNKYVGIIPVRI